MVAEGPIQPPPSQSRSPGYPRGVGGLKMASARWVFGLDQAGLRLPSVCSCVEIGVKLVGSQVLPSCWESALIR